MTRMETLSADGRAFGEARLLQIEDGPARGQRVLQLRNSVGLEVEIAVDRGFDISRFIHRGTSLGWYGPSELPFPVQAFPGTPERRFMVNFDGFLMTCGLDHFGHPLEGPADHFEDPLTASVTYPLHGRIWMQPARLAGYGVETEGERPHVWAEAVVRQTRVLGEVLELRRRVELDLTRPVLNIRDHVRNASFRPVRHAMLYHFNLGYPLLDEGCELVGDVPRDDAEAFRAEPVIPTDDAHVRFVPVGSNGDGQRRVGLRNPGMGATTLWFGYDATALPGLGLWKAFRSGIYALGLEPNTGATREDVQYKGPGTPHFMEAGERRDYHFVVEVETGG